MSDKELVRRVRLRAARMERLGIENDTTRMLRQELNAFYKKHPSKKSSKSGISITKKMNVEQRKQMRQILRAFYKSEESTPEGIEKEYKKSFKKYESQRKYTTQEKIIEPDYKKMSEQIEVVKRLLIDTNLNKIYGSKQIQAIYQNQRVSGLSVDSYKKAMLRFVQEVTGASEEDIINGEINSEHIYDRFSQDYVINKIQDYAFEEE